MSSDDKKDNIINIDEEKGTGDIVDKNTKEIEYKISESEVKESLDDIFIDEDDTFEVVVNYYKQKHEFCVEKVSDDFDATRKCNQIKVKVKYPSLGDYDNIRRSFRIKDDSTYQDIVSMEITRLMCLVRSWNLDRKLTEVELFKIHPKIIKGILVGIIENIGMDGIV